jgi:D-alanyl-D-alanine carboxypeptidase
MKIKILICAVIIFSACKKRPTDATVQSCTTASNINSELHPKNQIYTKLITDMEKAGFPGLTLRIEDQQGLWQKSIGYADIENNVKMDHCHIAKTASVTKLFTAVMIYQLQQAGKLSIEDKISMYIDDKHISKIKNAEKATIKDLLAHTSGIYDVVFDADFILYTFNNLDKEKTYEKLLSFAYGKAPAFEYGTKSSYNQTLNHVLLAMIINKVTGKDQSQMFLDSIKIPLGNMNNTFIRPQNNIPWNIVAKGYYDYRKEGTLQDLTPLFTGDGRGFTGIYSNPTELAVFINALYRNKTLLDSTSTSNMMKPLDVVDSNMNATIGGRIFKINVGGTDYTWYGHPGGEVNYAAGAFYSPTANATVTFIANYGVAFPTLGVYTDMYYDFRKEVFKLVCQE